MHTALLQPDARTTRGQRAKSLLIKCLRGFSLLGLPVLVATAPAAPLDADAVSADAAWVFHVDLEAMRQGPLGRALLNDASLGARVLLDQFGADFGLRPDQDLLGITLYAPPGDRSRGIALLHATQAADQMPQVLHERLRDDLTTDRTQSAPEYTWKVDGQPWHMTLRDRPPSTRLVVLAESTQSLRDAAGVLDGHRASLADAREPAPPAHAHAARAETAQPSEPTPRWPMLESPPAGAMIVALVTSDAWQGPGDQPRAMVLQGSRGLMLTVQESVSPAQSPVEPVPVEPAPGESAPGESAPGESAPGEPAPGQTQASPTSAQVAAELRIRMESGDLAEGMMHILQGMIATVRLSEEQRQGEADVIRLLREVSIRSEEDDAVLSLRAPSEQMIRTMQDHAAASAQRRREQSGRGSGGGAGERGDADDR